MGISLKADMRSFAMDGVFTISRGSRTSSEVVTVTLDDGTYQGQGECVPYPRYGESVEGVIADINAMANDIEAGLSREQLQTSMPAGAARNALDCAFWDLSAKREGARAWELLDLPEPDGLITAFTIGYDSPEAMREKAQANADRPLLKTKLAKADDIGRVAAVREGAPNSKITLDANEGWSAEAYTDIVTQLEAFDIMAVEQPMHADHDAVLADMPHPIPLIADESAHDSASLPKILGRYDMINIKLDKTGGLTEALELKRRALDAGMEIMVGCMIGSSLAMAPAMLVAHDAKIIDLDGPLLLAEDREFPIRFDGSIMHAPPRALWG